MSLNLNCSLITVYLLAVKLLYNFVSSDEPGKAVCLVPVRNSDHTVFGANHISQFLDPNIWPHLFPPSQPCSKEAIEAIVKRSEGSRCVIVCMYANITALLNSPVVQIGALGQSALRWAPIYFFVWPVVMDTDDLVSEAMRQVASKHGPQFQADSDIYVIFAVGKSKQVQLWEFYGIGSQTVFRQLPLRKNRVDLHDVEGKISRRSNFEQLPIRAIAENNAVLELDVKFRAGAEPPEFESGMNVETLQFLQGIFNFSIQAVTDDYDSDTETSTRVHGITEDRVMSQEADICITELYVTKRRAEYVKFLHPTYAEPLKGYFSRPDRSDFRDIFISGFDGDVWLVMILIYVLEVLVLKTFLWTTIRMVSTEPEDVSLNEGLYSESVLMVVGFVAQQGWHSQPVTKSIRITVLTGYLTGLVCFVAYSAAIVSSLSVKSEPVRRFEDLTDRNYRVLIDFGVNPPEWTYEVPNLKGLRIEDMNTSLALEKVVEGKAVFLSHADELYPALRDQEINGFRFQEDYVFCDRIKFIAVAGSASLTKYAMFLKKGSYLADFFNFGLLKEMESGILLRLLLRHIRTGRVTCSSEAVQSEEALGLRDIRSAFVVLLFGYLSSLLALLFEVLCSRKSEIRSLLAKFRYPGMADMIQ